jgi:GSCFA family protein
MNLSWEQALENTRKFKDCCRFPAKEDPRCNDLIFPKINKRFTIDPKASIFTIGSCFAREIEEKLVDYDLPTRGYRVPESEWPFRPNGILNEYNPGTMLQRITHSTTDSDYPLDTIVKVGSAYVDLSLPGGAAVTYERAIERREDIKKIYSRLNECSVVIITLGLVEAWFDQEHEIYLNRMPPLDVLRRSGARYAFRILDVFDAFPLLERTIIALSKETKVLLTVSPVPLQTTFSGQDAVVANSFSKSVLRVCAQRIFQKYTNVDYFPSYEIALSAGLGGFHKDNVHIPEAIVGRITDHMMKNYVVSADA